MYSLHQKHQSYSEIIYFDNQETLLEIEQLIVKLADRPTVTMDNIGNYRGVLNETSVIYYFPDYNYFVTNLDYEAKRAEYENSRSNN